MKYLFTGDQSLQSLCRQCFLIKGHWGLRALDSCFADYKHRSNVSFSISDMLQNYSKFTPVVYKIKCITQCSLATKAGWGNEWRIRASVFLQKEAGSRFNFSFSLNQVKIITKSQGKLRRPFKNYLLGFHNEPQTIHCPPNTCHLLQENSSQVKKIDSKGSKNMKGGDWIVSYRSLLVSATIQHGEAWPTAG